MMRSHSLGTKESYNSALEKKTIYIYMYLFCEGHPNKDWSGIPLFMMIDLSAILLAAQLEIK